MRDKNLERLLEEAIDITCPEKHMYKHGSGFFIMHTGKLGGGMAFDDEPFENVLAACLGYWLITEKLARAYENLVKK